MRAAGILRTAQRVRNRPADSLSLFLSLSFILSLLPSFYSHVDTKELCGRLLDQWQPEEGKAV